MPDKPSAGPLFHRGRRQSALEASPEASFLQQGLNKSGLGMADEPELEQFAVDAWRAPKRIFDAHGGPDPLGLPRVETSPDNPGRMTSDLLLPPFRETRASSTVAPRAD